jgi:hypothetical protein
MPHDHNAIEQATEQRAFDAAGLWRITEEQYEADVQERGVGPFYRRTQPGTANTPPRSE